MKTSKAMALTNAEVQEILAIKKWGTYRQEFPISYPSSLNGAPVTVGSFGIDNLPKLDVLLIFGGYPRIIKHAGEIIMKYDQKYPQPENPELEFGFLGYKPNKGQDTPGSEAQIYAMLMEQLGFDSKRVRKNLIKTFATDTLGHVAEIKQIIRNSDRLSRLDCPRIGLVTEAGYSQVAVQQLAFALRELQFYVFETPITPLSRCTFDVEDIENGYGVDVLLASVLNTLMDWNNTKFPLSKEKLEAFPNKEGIIATVRKYFLKGYAFYLPYPEQWELMGVSKIDALPLVNSRKIEITGKNIDGVKVGEGWETSSVPALQMQLKNMVDSLLDEWMKLGKYPY